MNYGFLALLILATTVFADSLVGFGSGRNETNISQLAFHGWSFDLNTNLANVTEDEDPALEPSSAYILATASCGQRVVWALLNDQLISLSQEDGLVISNLQLNLTQLEPSCLQFDENNFELLLIGLDYTDSYYKLFHVNTGTGELEERAVLFYSSLTFLNAYSTSTMDQENGIWYFLAQEVEDWLLFQLDLSTNKLTNTTIPGFTYFDNGVNVIQFDENNNDTIAVISKYLGSNTEYSLIDIETGTRLNVTSVPDSTAQSCNILPGGYDSSTGTWYFTCSEIGGFFSMPIDDVSSISLTEPPSINSDDGSPNTYGVFFLEKSCGLSDTDIPLELVEYCEDKGLSGYIGANCTISIEEVVDVTPIYDENGDLILDQYETTVNDAVVTIVFPGKNPNGSGTTYVIVTSVNPDTNPNQVNPEETLPEDTTPVGTGVEITIQNTSGNTVTDNGNLCSTQKRQAPAASPGAQATISISGGVGAVGAAVVGGTAAWGIYEYLDDDDDPNPNQCTGKRDVLPTPGWYTTDEVCGEDNTQVTVDGDDVILTTNICHFTQFQVAVVEAQSTSSTFSTSKISSTSTTTTSGAWQLKGSLLHYVVFAAFGVLLTL